MLGGIGHVNEAHLVLPGGATESSAMVAVAKTITNNGERLKCMATVVRVLYSSRKLTVAMECKEQEPCQTSIFSIFAHQ